MGRYQYQPGFREQFIQMMKDRHAPKCRMCNRPQRLNVNFANCPRCDWLLCPHCQNIHKPERHDWKEGDPVGLTNFEMCDKPAEDLAPCSACLYMLCPLCRSRHQPEQHKSSGWAVMDSKQAIARIGNPPHREPPPWLHAQFVPDCDECQKWHEKFKTVFPQEMKLYLEEQSKVWKERNKDIIEDLGIFEEELGGPL